MQSCTCLYRKSQDATSCDLALPACNFYKIVTRQFLSMTSWHLSGPTLSIPLTAYLYGLCGCSPIFELGPGQAQSRHLAVAEHITMSCGGFYLPFPESEQYRDISQPAVTWQRLRPGVCSRVEGFGYRVWGCSLASRRASWPWGNIHEKH